MRAILPKATLLLAAPPIVAFVFLWAMGGCSDNSSDPKVNPDAAPAATETVEAAPPPSEAAVSEPLSSVPGVRQEDFSGQMAAVIARTENIGKEWSTEEFNVAVTDQLRRLAGWMESGAVEDAAMASIAIETVKSTRLRPSALKIAFEDSLAQVARWRQSGNSALESVTGAAALAAHLNGILAPLKIARERHVKFKTHRVEPATDRVATTARYHSSGKVDHGIVEQTATLQLEWTAERQPRLVAITVSAYEEVIPGATGGLRFVDKAPRSFSTADSYRAELTQGADHWRERLQTDFGVDVNGLQGIALGDADGDGLEDVYICQQGGLPNKLYLRNGAGALRDVSAEAGVDWMELTRAALFLDLDNDGDQDLAMTQGWRCVLLENDGKARFTMRAEALGSAAFHSIAAADHDSDGDLDLYICGRNPGRGQATMEGFLGTPVPFHDANNGGANILLENNGNWEFSDVTVETGMDVNNRRYSYAAAWEDYDNDGDQDLYVANDFGRNCLYRNDRGKFVDVAAKAGVEDISAGMGVAWADVDHDGDMDLHVSNMFSSAGNRIAYQRQFRPGASESRSAYRRHARGNSLFENNGDGTFSDVSESAGITLGRWAWGALFADLNNDGWEDLLVANGFISTEDTGDL